MPRTRATTEPYVVPFTVLIDTNESQPFTFDGLRADANKANRPLVINHRFASLGRYPHSKGDYTIEGYAERVAVERKSMEDAWGTVLGWDTAFDREKGHAGRRERFEKELENLSKLDAAVVIVEASMGDCLKYMPQRGKKSIEVNRKIFHRTVLAYIQDYVGVQWMFCQSRRHAEVFCYRYLARWYRKEMERVEKIELEKWSDV